MGQQKGSEPSDQGHKPSRVPTGSAFYTRVVPILLVAMAIVLLILILIAVGVLLGFTPYR